MLTLTGHAQDAVRALTTKTPASAGLRVAPGKPGNHGFELSLVTEPVPGDALIDDGGVRVFVEPQTARLLGEQTLDAQLEGGELNFFLARRIGRRPLSATVPAPAGHPSPPLRGTRSQPAAQRRVVGCRRVQF